MKINIGDKFSRLTVLETVKNKHGQTQLKCECDCGKLTLCMPYNLRKGLTKSCGCLKRENLIKSKTKIKIGDKLGLITVLEDVGEHNNHGRKLFKFSCECGKIKTGAIHSNMKSCGCLKRQAKDPLLTEFKRYKKNCIKRNINFSLSKNDFIKLIKSKCYYCGQIPSMKMHVGRMTKNGIDRLDSTKGYNPKNCVACCADCNFAKRKLSLNDFLNLIKKIYLNHFQYE